MKRHQKQIGKSDQALEVRQPRAEMTPTYRSMLEHAERSVTISQNGMTKAVTTREALIERYKQVAIKEGSPHALNQITKLMLAAEFIDAKIAHENIESGRRVLARQMQVLEDTIRNARDEGLDDACVATRANDVVPHPDDIIIDDKGWQLRGPYDGESLALVHELIAIRDAFLLQHQLDERSALPETNVRKARAILEGFDLAVDVSDETMSGRSALLIGSCLDERLPKRFRSTFKHHIELDMQCRRMSKRELLKTCHQTLKGAGIPHVRGWLSPPFVQGVMFVRVLYELSKACLALSRQTKTPTPAQCQSLVKHALTHCGFEVEHVFGAQTRSECSTGSQSFCELPYLGRSRIK